MQDQPSPTLWDPRRPREALRSRPRPRIRPRGVMEYWSVGVLAKIWNCTPRPRGWESFHGGYRTARLKTARQDFNR
jgi:hypothetical protein